LRGDLAARKTGFSGTPKEGRDRELICLLTEELSKKKKAVGG